MTVSVSRRKFVRSSLAAMATFSIVPRHVLGGPGQIAPSDELTKAIIGVGGMGRGHLSYEGARLVAICDVDDNHLKRAQAMAGPDVRAYRDFRELVAQPDIDIIHIATPPHWHALMSIAAAQAGKDIWCEKPMTRTIGEGRAVVKAVQQYDRIFRINTWFRFHAGFYNFGTDVKPIKKIVESGLLGWPLKVTVNESTGFSWKFYWSGKNFLPPQAVPHELDYDLWLGPAPVKPYHPHRVHGTFRGYWDYDGGGLGDMGQHYLDPVQYLLNKDDDSPVEIDVDAPQQHPDAVGSWCRIWLKYADGCEIILDGENKDAGAPFIAGPNGKLWPGLRSDIANLRQKLTHLPDPAPQLTDFSTAVRTRRKFALDEEKAFRSCTLVNLSKVALRVGRKLYFDPTSLQFINDVEANRLISQPMRAPWHV
ncbi:Gfo/Idh/MocA family oxidoreductase [candidate division KSB1 bacterium]|nr:Gfo/Idh/MocA family oxidoreductase [candidate division KSB1 bacterium]